MPSGKRAIRIPENLRVIVCVQVDEARCDNSTCSVQNAVGGLSLQAADLGDLAVLDGNVADIARRTCTVDDGAAKDA